LFKKRAFYLSIALLTAPLVAVGDPLPVSSLNPVQQALSQLPQDCPGLAARVSESSKQLLQGFYLGHNDQLVWTDNQRLSALQAALAQLADDGLNPGSLVNGQRYLKYCVSLSLNVYLTKS